MYTTNTRIEAKQSRIKELKELLKELNFEYSVHLELSVFEEENPVHRENMYRLDNTLANIKKELRKLGAYVR